MTRLIREILDDRFLRWFLVVSAVVLTLAGAAIAYWSGESARPDAEPAYAGESCLEFSGYRGRGKPLLICSGVERLTIAEVIDGAVRYRDFLLWQVP